MKDVFQVVTDRILSQLQKGIIPWRRTWSSNEPTSYQTNKAYQGINALILQDAYESPYWLTFRQCQKLGGSVRAGEHGSPIVFVDSYPREETQADGTVLTSYRRFLKYYTVFNWEQTKGLPEKVPVGRDNTTIPQAEEVLRRRNPIILYHASQPHFSPHEDALYMPGLDQFEDSAFYYSAAFHELIHWTGGRARLARAEIINYSREKEYRAREELTAEIGAAFLCKTCAIDNQETLKDSTAYIQSWLKVFKGDNRIIMQASKQARIAAEYILTGEMPKILVAQAATGEAAIA